LECSAEASAARTIQGLRNAYQFLFATDGTLSDRVAETAETFQRDRAGRRL